MDRITGVVEQNGRPLFGPSESDSSGTSRRRALLIDGAKSGGSTGISTGFSGGPLFAARRDTRERLLGVAHVWPPAWISKTETSAYRVESIRAIPHARQVGLR